MSALSTFSTFRQSLDDGMLAVTCPSPLPRAHHPPRPLPNKKANVSPLDVESSPCFGRVARGDDSPLEVHVIVTEHIYRPTFRRVTGGLFER